MTIPRTCSLLAVVSLAAQAAPIRPVQLGYERAAASAPCPEEAEIRSSLAARLGFDPFTADAPSRVAISIAPKGTGHQAEVVLVDEVGSKRSRTLVGVRPDCSDLREALALTLSVAVEAFTSSPPAPVAPVPAAPPPVVQRPIEPPTDPPSRSPPVHSVDAFVDARLALALGAAPEPAAAISFGVGLSGRWWSLSLEPRVQLPAGTKVETGRIDVASLTADVLPCANVWRLRACGVGSAGVVWSWASNLDSARLATTPRVAVGARLEVLLPLTARVELLGHGEFLVALARTSLKVGTATIWQTPPVGASFGLGALVHLGETDSAGPDK